MNNTGRTHRPVLVDELIDGLDLEQSNTVIDATVGFGGHASAVLDCLDSDGRLIGLERDPTIHARVSSTFKDDPRVTILRRNYRELDAVVSEQALGAVDAVYFDLGVNSFHFDKSERGFSFHREQDRLDMRFDPDEAVPTAEEWLNDTTRDQLIDTFRDYGEVRSAVTIVDKIMDDRPLRTVGDLRTCVEKVVPPPYRRGELARVFQAIRIHVNRELEHLEEGLSRALDVLAPGGRMAVISFHSLEDRTVKEFFREQERSCVCPPELPVCACDAEQRLAVMDRSPVHPGREEIEANSRARSASMRIAIKSD